MMPLYPAWSDILLRLALAFAAGAIIGFDRETQGHAAGPRTTTLVALAAASAMKPGLFRPNAGQKKAARLVARRL